MNDTVIEAILTGGKDEQQQALQELLVQVEQGAVSLRDLIAHRLLADAFTNQADQKRARSMGVLASAVHRLGSTGKQLDPASVTVIMTFFIERSLDFASQQEVLDGVLALLAHQAIPNAPALIPKLVTALFSSEHVHVQSMAQSNRRTAFEIFDALFEKYAAEMKALGEQAVFGFIQAMDGEKDPRNLLLCFKLLTTICKLIPEAANFEDDLFDITSCYFPITYTEKPGDPNAIKKADLVHRLRETMIVSGSLWIAFMLDKLSSSIIETKLDVLHSFKFAFTDSATNNGKPLWNIESIKVHLPDIQSQLTNEVMQSTDPNVPVVSMQVLSDLAYFLSRHSNLDTLKFFVTPLVQTCTHYFQEKQDGKLAISGSKIMQAVASASYESARIVLDRAMPLIIEKYFGETEPAVRLALLKMIVGFCKATAAFHDSSKAHPLEPYQGKIFVIIKSSTVAKNTPLADLSNTDEQERVDAIEGLAVLAKLNRGQLYDAKLVGEMISVIEDALAKHSVHAEVSGGPKPSGLKAASSISLASLGALVSVASVHPAEVISRAVNVIVADLEEQIKLLRAAPAAPVDFNAHSPKVAVGNHIAWLHALSDPSAIQSPDHIGPVIVPTLSTSTSPDCQAHPVVLAKIQELLLGLLGRHFDLPSVVANTLSSLARTVTTTTMFLRTLTVILLSFTPYPESLPVLAKWTPVLVANVMGHLSEAQQFELLLPLYNAFVHNQIQPLLAQSPEFQGKAFPQKFSPLSPESSQTQATLNLMFAEAVSNSSGSLAGVDPNQAPLRLVMFRDIFEAVFRFSVSTQCYQWSESEHFVLCRCLGSILNKFPVGQVMGELLNKVHTELTALLTNPSTPDQTKQLGQAVFTWVTKAVLQRGLLGVEPLWSYLLELLRQPSLPLAKHMASTFRIIFDDLPQLPNKRVLYKQRHFTSGLAFITKAFEDKSSSPQFKTILSLALGGLLHGLPNGVLLQSATTVMPLLVQSLQSPEELLQHGTLLTLKVVIETDNSIVVPHLQSIIPSLLDISRSQRPESTAESRVLALECLLSLLKVPYVSLFRFKEMVLWGLKGALDDRKRLVRKAAVKCRNEWFVLK